MPSRKRPEPPVLFVDRSLGNKTVPAALRSQGVSVVVHDDRFPRDAPDTVWLTEAGRHGWIVLTQDARIRYRQIERQAVCQFKARVFVLAANNLKGEMIAEAFVKALERIKRLAARQPGPFIAKVYRDGEVTMWTDFS